MITYNAVAAKPRLEIRQDDCLEIEDFISNMGIKAHLYIRGIFTFDTNFKNAVEDAAAMAHDFESHAKLVLKKYHKGGYAVSPVYVYQHSGTSIDLFCRCRWDSSLRGMLLYKKEDLELIKGELNTLTKIINGECYYFDLYDENGEVEDSCGGFFDVEDMKEHLPAEFKDENLTQYIVY